MRFIWIMGVASLTTVLAQAEPLRFRQDRNGASVEELSASERASLGDPLFNAVLRDHAETTSLKGLENLLQPDLAKRALFVVHENIADPRPGQQRRSVIAFSGRNPTTTEVLDPNVMLSVFFTSREFPDEPSAIEAWGWDNRRGRYNYYKMDAEGSFFGKKSWKFRGSSLDADLLTAEERRGTCLECHVNGGPVMKELLFPWNNWHSFRSPAQYLTSTWEVRTSPRVMRLRGAEELETQFLISAISQFNLRRLNSGLARDDSTGNVSVDAAGKARLVEGQRFLRPLFETTEINLISSAELSGMHRIGDSGATGPPAAPILIPSSFFLNSNLIAGSGFTNYLGVGVLEARDFEADSQQGTIRLAPEEYQRLINESRVELGGTVGDANFAWFVPEASHIDNSMIDQLMRRGVLTPEFVASVLAVDLERPVFSEARASLLRFVPDEFSFELSQDPNSRASGRHPDPLTNTVIERLKAANPLPDSPEADLLQLLEDPDPVARLRERVVSYRNRVINSLVDPLRRADELDRLFRTAIERRALMKAHPVLSSLDETGDRLLPLPRQ